MQLALEMKRWSAVSLLSLTPRTMVTSGPLAGAEMMTRLAPPRVTWSAKPPFGPSRSVKRPVDSTTTVTPRSFHGSLPGSRSFSTLMVLPLTFSPPSTASTVPGKRP